MAQARCSLLADAWREAERYKWIRSEQAGHDLGPKMIQEWFRVHWRGFVRAKIAEHTLGIRFYEELGAKSFAVAERIRPRTEGLLEWIIEALRRGAENLEIIVEAQDRNYPPEEVHAILELVDINAWRFPPAEVERSFSCT